MSLQALLDELYKKILEIPTVREREVIEPEHHNLLKEAVSLLYEIVRQLSQVSAPVQALQGWIIVWFITAYGGPQYFIPYTSINYYSSTEASVTFPSPIILKNFRVYVERNGYTDTPVYVSLVKNHGEAKITITILNGATGWFANTTDTLSLEEGDTLCLETDALGYASWFRGWAYVHALPKPQQ